jgi:hypothetical protein
MSAEGYAITLWESAEAERATMASEYRCEILAKVAQLIVSPWSSALLRCSRTIPGRQRGRLRDRSVVVRALPNAERTSGRLWQRAAPRATLGGVSYLAMLIFVLTCAPSAPMDTV